MNEKTKEFWLVPKLFICCRGDRISFAEKSSNLRPPWPQTIYCKMKEALVNYQGFLLCRGDRIRTCDPLVPNQVRYRPALLPEPVGTLLLLYLYRR